MKNFKNILIAPVKCTLRTSHLLLFVLLIVFLITTIICLCLSTKSNFREFSIPATEITIATVVGLIASYIFMFDSNRNLKAKDSRTTLIVDAYGHTMGKISEYILFLTVLCVIISILIPDSWSNTKNIFLQCIGIVSLILNLIIITACIMAMAATICSATTMNCLVETYINDLTSKNHLEPTGATSLKWFDSFVKSHNTDYALCTRYLVYFLHNQNFTPNSPAALKGFEDGTEYMCTFDRLMSNLLGADVYSKKYGPDISNGLHFKKNKINVSNDADIEEITVILITCMKKIENRLKNNITHDDSFLSFKKYISLISSRPICTELHYKEVIFESYCLVCELQMNDKYNLDLHKTWILNYVAIYAILCEHNIMHVMNKNSNNHNITVHSVLERAIYSYMFNSHIAQMIYVYKLHSKETIMPKFGQIYNTIHYFSGVLGKLFINKTLKNMDFRFAKIPYFSFYGSDLSDSDFSSAHIGGCDFTECCLKNCSWVDVHLDGAGILLNGAHLEGSTFGRVNLNEKSCLNDCTLGHSSILDGKFSETSMISVTFSDMSFHSTYFEGVMMEASSISECRIDKCQFIPTSARLCIKKCHIEGHHTQHVRKENTDTLKDTLIITKKLRMLDCQKEKHVVNNIVIPYDFEEYDLLYNGRLFEVDIEPCNNCTDNHSISLSFREATKISDGRSVLFTGISFDKNFNGPCCSLEGSSFYNTTLTNSKLFGCNMRAMDFISSSLFGTHAVSSMFDLTYFKDLDLANTPSLRGFYAECSFLNCLFESSNIANTDFYNCNLNGTKITNSKLDSVSFVLNDHSLDDKYNLYNESYELIFDNCNIRDIHIDCDLKKLQNYFYRVRHIEIHDMRVCNRL